MSGKNDKSVGNAWLSFSAIGGLMACPAIPGYFFAVVIPIAFSYLAYVNYALPENKIKFIILAVVNFLFGILLRFFPHNTNGSLTGLGIMVAMIILISSCVFVFKMFRLEARLE